MLRRLGVEIDGRNYTPHVTLARPRHAPLDLVRITHVDDNHDYRAQAFDPTNGNLVSLPSILPDSNSGGVARKPASIQSDDWVIVVERSE